ncbi:MAG: serine hydrolase [Candidatus Dormibacteraceae bacterium]
MQALEETIERERERHRVPGVAVAVVRGGEVLLSRGFGLRDVAGGLEVTPQTLFAIGSATKAFTTALAGTLVDEGKLDWDRPVRHYLPGFRMYDPVATEHLNVRDLLCHRSGLPRHDLVWYGNETLTKAQVVERLRYLEPNKTFREAWQYNNLMYLTAGHLCAELSGMSWEDAVRTRLLEPLGMGNTNFSVRECEAAADHATPYQEQKDEISPMPFRGLDLAGPAGSINSCIEDLTSWAVLNVNGGKLGDRQIVSEAALKVIQSPAMVTPEGGELWPEYYETGYALGWFLRSYRGYKVLHHGGNIDGFSAMVSLLPSHRIGVVVLTNRNVTPLRDVIPFLVYDHLLELAPIDWGERHDTLYKAMFGGLREAADLRRESRKNAPPSHPLADYGGRYHHPGYGDLLVGVEDEARLVPHYNNLDVTAEHVHFDVWELEIADSELPSAIQAVFRTGADGAISAVEVNLEPAVDPIVFEKQAAEDLSSREVLSRYEGRYAMGPLTAAVELQADGRLTVELVGQGRAVLLPAQERSFKVEGQPALSVEFAAGVSGAIEKMVVQPVGVFTKEG